MKLLISRPSPYARKAWAAVLELGLEARVAVEVLPARPPTTPKPDLDTANPLGKVPVLLREDGHAILDSRVITAFLDALAGGGRLFPAEGEARWSALTLEALADGIMDAGVTVRLETLRPEPRRDAPTMAAHLEKIARALDLLEREPPAMAWHGGQLALLCATEWLAFRGIGPDPLAGRPRLAAWHARVAARPALLATRPA